MIYIVYMEKLLEFELRSSLTVREKVLMKQ